MFVRAGKHAICLAMATGLTAVLAGCTEKPPVGLPVERAWESPPAPSVAAQTPGSAGAGPAMTADPGETSTQPAGAGAADGGVADSRSSTVVATVNGEAITEARLFDMLVDSHGLAVLEQLILLTAAKQRAAELSVTVTPADIAAAEDEALRRIAAPVGDPQAAPLDRPAAERLLAEFLRLKGLSRTEWDCRMEQRAYLRKIAEAEVAKMEVTEQMLRDEYALAYGERVQIRHIQTSSHEAINRAAAMLVTTSFEEVARQLSENAITREQGGLMPPFTRHDGAVPPLIREQAFTLEPGSTSPPMREGAWYHIIKVERRFPASGVGFENVEPDTLRKSLTDRLTRQRTDELDAELFQSARIQIRHTKLDQQFRERHRQRQAAR
ncbi:MAG TPA: peptidylprolyl isomerase [Phycisphaerae bacterium]|nr:peptidylprolyl isomerase [Phycisphaerae bacterium]HQE28728.1 peptidylprolyl isomerase [Phycisphaerae bacterium]